ncbi:autophagy protein 13 [Chamberlinius hualienensis]
MTENKIKLSAAELKEMEKCVRYFAYKMVQVVVQSRLGEKAKTISKPPDLNHSLFGLSLDDMAEVNNVTKTATNGQLPSINCGMCVEISLQTSDGDKMVLEFWHLALNNKCESTARVYDSVYSRMSSMLKSLLVLTRMTPAYKLSLQQGAGSFVICYRVYMGEPNVNVLGEKYQQMDVGKTETPLGVYTITVIYRTQMTISPQKVNKEVTFMVKSDHFNPDMSPKCYHKPHAPYQNGNYKNVMDELASACEDCQEDINRSPIVLDNFQATNPVNTKLKNAQPAVPKNIEKQIDEVMKVGALITEEYDLDHCENDYILPEPPFSNLIKNIGNIEKTVSQLNSLNSQQTNGKLPTHCEKMENVVETNDMQKSKTLIMSCIDDYVMVDVDPPFGCDVATDLSAFLRECQTAPPLLVMEQKTFADEVQELGDQLAMFQASQPDLDIFVKTLCSDEMSK